MIDIEKYRHYIADLNLNHEDETECLRSLADLMQHFVDLPFDEQFKNNK